VASLPRDVRAYLAGGLAFQHTYAFRVRAYNAYGFSPFSGTVLARTAAADLVPRSLTGVPAAAAPGEKLRLTARTANQGTIAARSTIARFYLLDGAPSPILLVGKASVTSLAAGAEVNTTASVTVPRSTPVGTFRVRVCVDDGRVVAEGDESNNCLLAAAGLTVGRPDLAVVSLDTPPARVRRGQSFTARDEVENLGVAVATSSTVRYYLGPPSGPETRGPRLAGTHSVPSLLPGARLLKSTSVKVPIDTALGTYRLLACADDRLAVIESDETNNCRVSGATVRVEP
jgi:subtilase family serine protease